MYFKFACPSCGKNLKVREEDGGRRARCPYCRNSVMVPKLTPTPTQVPEARPRARSAADELAHAAASTAPAPASASATRPVAKRPAAEPASTAGFTQAGFDGTNVPILTSAIVGLAASLAFYVALLPFAGSYLHALFYERGWVPGAATFLFFWSLAILVLKHAKLRRQRSALLFDLLPTETADDITADNAAAFTSHIRSLPADAADSFLINRVLRGLEYFRVRRNNPEVAALLASQSEIDANAVHSSYALVKVFTWAIPILGFIGTVIGISSAVAGFGGELGGSVDVDALKAKLGAVTDGLGVAFDTTLVALVMSLLVAIPTTALRKAEDDLLNGVDEYCNENLLKRLNDDEGQVAAAANTRAIRKAIEGSMTAHHAELRAWTQKLESIGSTLTDEVVRGWTKIFREIDASQASGADAHRVQLDELRAMMAELTARADRNEREAAEQMRAGAESMRAQFDAMAEAVGELNRVLGELGGRQIVVESRIVTAEPVARRAWWPFGGKRRADNGG